MLKNIFKRMNSLSEQLEKLEQRRIELEKLQNRISEWNRKASEIQSKFNFILPNYIIDEIIENEDRKDYLNLHYLINCAVINGRISETDGNIIKQVYY